MCEAYKIKGAWSLSASRSFFFYLFIFLFLPTPTTHTHDPHPRPTTFTHDPRPTTFSRGHGFESRSSLNFFRLSFCNCLSCVVTARIFLLFDLSSAVQIYVSYVCIQRKSCKRRINEWPRTKTRVGAILETKRPKSKI